ncbi:DUF397 domain-containing protein [Actinomadura rudentiformis]|uniref:DUF397 domain-containing protein n=1 Tax=Actinomadura rudentiformis TaxID=359158 RepID=A0A6H9YU32_9ACTN|nr:DUF397 domain-containing protein [Actinomadura rudentiformis]
MAAANALSPSAFSNRGSRAAKQLTPWKKSRACQASNGCVEMASFALGTAGARDSVLGQESPVLTFTQPEVRALFRRIKAGDLDLH